MVELEFADDYVSSSVLILFVGCSGPRDCAPPKSALAVPVSCGNVGMESNERGFRP